MFVELVADADLLLYLTKALLCEMFFPKERLVDFVVALMQKSVEALHPGKLRPMSTLPVLYKILRLFMLEVSGLTSFICFLISLLSKNVCKFMSLLPA